MPDSPFDLTGPIFGQPTEHFSCVQCGAPAGGFICMNLKTDDDFPKPSLIFAYGLCQRCGALFWNEAGQKAMRELKLSVASVGV